MSNARIRRKRFIRAIKRFEEMVDNILIEHGYDVESVIDDGAFDSQVLDVINKEDKQ